MIVMEIPYSLCVSVIILQHTYSQFMRLVQNDGTQKRVVCDVSLSFLSQVGDILDYILSTPTTWIRLYWKNKAEACFSIFI
ncbi:uncharacterized protein GGS22DRAFT_71950 [Annulohypoxylon maeteangense]|uniref:uncharacterized protein n=1 Tax=Annulohypoxylon maeteangense TaxID=1927788 RepID=UPI0020075EE2|nr:uncharacterized protein GGS22DRAFT_71950 [Annulohypoxylon maeteangense]KAI0881205.1 hypothetical protein GGS22DRAFT_71950 [Annulohypoxylon maeteangense]